MPRVLAAAERSVSFQSRRRCDGQRCRLGHSAAALDQRSAATYVPSAYIQGEQKASEQVVARPPVGFREYDERGVEVY